MTTLTKPYTVDYTVTGDTVYSAVDKLEDNIDDLYAHLSSNTIGQYASSLNTAISTIGSIKATLVVDETVTLTANATVPSTLHLVFLRDGKITLGNYNLVVNGPLTAGLFQIFEENGTGSVSFGSNSVSQVYPQWWGATGDGSTDDTSAIQSAIDTGKTIYLAPGMYISTKLTLSNSNQTIKGDGIASVLKLKTGTDDDLIYAASKSNLVLADLKLDGNHSAQSGNCDVINLNTCTDILLRNLTVVNGYGNVTGNSGAQIFIEDCTRVILDHCSVTYGKYEGVQIVGTTGGSHRVIGGRYSHNGYSGISTWKSPDVVMVGVVADYNGDSNITLNGPRNRAISCYGWNSTTDHGINVGHDSTGSDASGSEVIGGSYNSNGVYGVHVYGGSTTTQYRVRIIGVNCEGNSDDGIILRGTQLSSVKGCTVTSSGDDAIRLMNADYCVIEGNICVSSAGTDIEIDSDSSNNLITNNLLRSTSRLTDAGSYNVITGNKGFLTENNGTATISNGSTSVDVSHGLALTPSIQDISVTPAGDWGTATYYYVDSVTSTQFTIHVDQDPGQDVEFAWAAVIR